MSAPIAISRADDAKTALTHSRLLGERLYLHTYIRLAFAAVIILGALFAKHVVGIVDLSVPALIVLGLVVAVYNVAAFFLCRHRRDPARSLADHKPLIAIMYAAIALDYVALTVAIWLVGGTRSPFVVFYLPHVTITCVILSRRAAFGCAALAYFLLLGLILSELLHIAPPRLPAGAINDRAPLDARYALTVAVVYGMMLLLLVYLLTSFIERVREGEARVRYANVALEQLSDMRRDFLHIALHNIQSPVGAVTMYLENMNAGLGGAVTEKQQQWIDRSLQRLGGLNAFLQNFRMLNALESGKVDDEFVDVDVAALIDELADEHRELATMHNHVIEFDVPAGLPPVRGIPRLLREAVVNFIRNAIKYTPDGGRIVVRAVHRSPSVRIEVQDNGIGISKEDQARLFGEFVRLNRVGTPVANVPGSGLGLSIVRRVVEHHGGHVFIESEPGQGSTFIVELPARVS